MIWILKYLMIIDSISNIFEKEINGFFVFWDLTFAKGI